MREVIIELIFQTGTFLKPAALVSGLWKALIILLIAAPAY